MSEDSNYPAARASTHGPGHHFFGYYDKSPWDATGRYMLGLETGFIDRPPAADDVAVIGLIDTENGNAWRPLAETTAWNWQQGTMLRWMPAAPDRETICNAREGGRFVSIVRDVFTGECRTLPRPVYTISPDGKAALSVNFSRIADTRPGYGYAGIPDPGRDEAHPEDDGVYLMNLDTAESRLIVTLAQVAEFRPEPSMEGAKHWFNHLLFNTDGTRFLFLHRWKRPEEPRRWSTRLFTADPDGSRLCCLSGGGMVSHFDWHDPAHILAWAREPEIGNRFFLYTDRTEEKVVVGEGVLTCDGHCSYSPDRRWILTDAYPDSQHKRTLILFRVEDGKRVDIGRFFSPPELGGEIRCDLHPRWSRDGGRVCVDSAHEKTRQMYVVCVGDIVEESS